MLVRTLNQTKIIGFIEQPSSNELTKQVRTGKFFYQTLTFDSIQGGSIVQSMLITPLPQVRPKHPVNFKLVNVRFRV